jgi:Na+/H+-dicarboxylate symporter
MKKIMKIKLPGFTTQVVLGVLLGIAMGIFFGESIAPAGMIGTAYVRLLQMTIIPYIMVSLIHGFGRLTRQQAIRVAPRLALIMLIFWAIGLTIVMLMPMTFPDRQGAAFFNPTTLITPEKVSFVDLFIPANPFQALASGTIPAVVLFSILFGVALMGAERKDGFLMNLGLITDVLTRVTGMVVKTTPIGVFAMTAAAAGTMNINDFAKLQVYFVTYIAACIFLTFLAFPLLISLFTPFSYGRILRHFKDAFIMAFTTGNLFVVLPLLMEQAKTLFEEHRDTQEGREYIDILVPVAFNFPNMGKLIALLFVLFGAWFVGSPIAAAVYPRFLSTGMVTFFGGIDLALPFMLSFMGLPADLFNIYSVSGVINGRFATLLACMELISLTLITGVWLSGGKLKLNFRRLLINSMILIISAVAMLASIKIMLNHTVPSIDDQIAKLKSMDMAAEYNMHAVDSKGKLPAVRHKLRSLLTGGSNRVIRVGYFPNNMPFSYLNDEGKLVGYDIELAGAMSADLNLRIELYPVTLTNIVQCLSEDRLDAVLGVTLNSSDIKNLAFSQTYQELTLGLVMNKQTKKEVQRDSDDFFKQSDLKVALTKPNPYIETFKVALPNINMLYISAPEDFYKSKGGYDVFLTSMECGSVWNMLYPGFEVLPIKNGALKNHVVIAVSANNDKLLRQVNEWLRLKQSQGLFDLLYDYWVRGLPRELAEKQPRWCIMHDVLGWGTAE